MNKYQYKVQGVDYDVEIEEVAGNLAKVNVNGIHFDVELMKPISHTQLAPHHQNIAAPKVVPARKEPIPAPDAEKPKEEPTEGIVVKSPLPGTITSIAVAVGDKVSDGDVLVVLEAMKMQNNIECEGSGTVRRIDVKPGDAVMEGSVLLIIA